MARAVLDKNDAVPLLYVMVPATSVFPGARSWNVLVLIVVGSMASLNVADTVVVGITLVAALDGFTEVTVGGAVPEPVLVVKTTSTQ